MVDVEAALGEELFDVSVGWGEPQVPADRQGITSGGRRNPANSDGGVDGRTRRGQLIGPGRIGSRASVVLADAAVPFQWVIANMCTTMALDLLVVSDA
ncbi:hypothetical protein ACG83_30885 [Frankia sp. R43]|nr:hypothetical protein ACG83_30885 [Frankia sp. R43]